MIMKRIILSLIGLMSAIGIFAQSQIYDVNGIYYRLIQDPDSNNANDLIASVTTKGDTDHYQGSISIPSSVTIDGTNYTVGVIGDMAFKTCKSLTSVTIPASVKQIPNGAFYGCDNLTSIVVANGNQVYDSRDNCNAVIETATNTLIAGCKYTFIPSSTTAIGEAAFYGCNTLSSINLPYSIKSIGKWAFLDCTGLTSVAIPSSMTEIETGVFEGCTSLASIEIPASVTRICANAFGGCCNLIIEVPSTVTEISGSALNGVGTLYWNSNSAPSYAIREASIYGLEFGKDVTDITWSVSDFEGLRSINVPNSVKRIGFRSLSSLDYLETVIWNSNIPLSRVNIIKEGLKNIVFGDSVSCIEPNIFACCEKLESISVDPGNPYYDSRNNCNAVIGSVDVDRYYDDINSGINYHIDISKDCLVLGCKNTVTPDDVVGIGYYAFCNKFRWFDFSSFTIPANIKTIGYCAFSGCISLRSLHISAGVSEIVPGAFVGCCGLDTITVDANNPFYNSTGNCNAIIDNRTNTLVLGCKNTVIPDGIKAIDDYAFSYAFDSNNIYNQWYMGVQSPDYKISIPTGVTRIGYRAFEGCDCLSEISISSTVTEIGAYAFENCYGITSLTIPEGIKNIADGLFDGCISLESINIPQSVESIGEYAFYWCRSLESIIIPEGVTVINRGTFSNCSSLSYISLPSTIIKMKSFDSYEAIFANCNKLKTAGPKGGGYNYEFGWQDTIPSNAFLGLNYLESVYIPKTINAVYECELQANIAVNNSAYCEPNEILPVNFAYDCGSVGAVFYGCDSLKKVAVAFKNTKLMQLWRDQENNDSLSFRESPMDFNLYKLNPIKSITILDDSINDLSSILTKDIKEVVVSQYVQYVDSSMFKSGSKTVALDRLYFNPNINYYRPRNFDLESNLEKITVESGNRYYSSVDGVLLNKDGSRLILCPDKRNDGYRIPETVVTVDAESFMYCKGLKFVRIPGSVERIGERAFENCSSIDWITFEGSPEIGLNAFGGCQNIRSIAAHSNIPGIMHLNTTPQPIITGDYNSIAVSNGLTVTPKYNEELGRKVSEINSTATTWSCPIVTEDVSSGQYKMIVGVLPNLDQMPNKFSVKVVAILEDNTPITLFSGRQGPKTISFNASGTQYDSVFVRDLTFPDGCKSIEITLTSVKGANLTKRMVLDRVFFEPIGDDFPEDAYAGPFTQRVFNNAMLYVPDGALSTYQAASGWKLFKNIDIDTDVAPIIVDDRKDGRGIVIDNMIIYDPMGRKVDVESIDMLAPGLYIIDGSTFLIK